MSAQAPRSRYEPPPELTAGAAADVRALDRLRTLQLHRPLDAATVARVCAQERRRAAREALAEAIP